MKVLQDSPHKTGSVSRRGFLKLGSMATAATAVPRWLQAQAASSGPRSLAFYHTHTGERLRATYWADGRYLPEALAQINWILRDYRRDEIKPIDTRLLDLLYALARKLETREPFHIICGYRSTATNEFLRTHTIGVAQHSMHLEAKAADIRVPGRDLARVQRAATALHDGGVGTYPHSDFVHVDVGRVRYWRLAGLLRPLTQSPKTVSSEMESC
ncbi:MAG TPA: YcbK family protein [Terriglobia bacterium]|nr:YcbK family protein [Terriglobia bacterium]